MKMSANSNTTTDKPQKQAAPDAMRFPLGSIYLTPGAQEAHDLAGQSPREFLSRHARLDQGELCDEDHRENLFSVDKPLRIFSAFKTARGEKLWVKTEADREASTRLLPSEY